MPYIAICDWCEQETDCLPTSIELPHAHVVSDMCADCYRDLSTTHTITILEEPPASEDDGHA